MRSNEAGPPTVVSDHNTLEVAGVPLSDSSEESLLSSYIKTFPSRVWLSEQCLVVVKRPASIFVNPGKEKVSKLSLLSKALCQPSVQRARVREILGSGYHETVSQALLHQTSCFHW